MSVVIEPHILLPPESKDPVPARGGWYVAVTTSSHCFGLHPPGAVHVPASCTCFSRKSVFIGNAPKLFDVAIAECAP